jgi:transposase
MHLLAPAEVGVLVTIGVDTHVDVHVAVALDQYGRRLGSLTVATTPAGYGALLAWADRLGTVACVGVEGAGSFGAGLSRWLQAHQIPVMEVSRPNRQLRRQAGKSDTIDAEAAARAVQADTALGQPKTADGHVEMVRSLRLARSSAVKARTQAANQLHGLVITAPDPLRVSCADFGCPSWSVERPSFGPARCRTRRSRRSNSRCGRSPAAIGSCRPRSPPLTGTCSGW